MERFSRRHLLREQRGFSLLETLVVVALIGVASTFAAFQMSVSRQTMVGDAGMRVIMAQMNTAREMAIAQRRYMRVTFTGSNIVNIVREDTTTTTTNISSITLEGGVTYALTSGLPDTPDAFGKLTATYFGTVTNVKFSPEGTLVNQDGQTSNGTVFLALSSVPLASRAVTVLGSTGRVRGYRWMGSIWKLV